MPRKHQRKALEQKGMSGLTVYVSTDVLEAFKAMIEVKKQRLRDRRAAKKDTKGMFVPTLSGEVERVLAYDLREFARCERRRGNEPPVQPPEVREREDRRSTTGPEKRRKKKSA